MKAKNNLFILEKDEKIRTRIARFFSQKDFDVHSYEDEKEMLKGFDEFGTPDVLITDYELKKTTALSLIDRLRMKIKVIVCVTGFFDNDEIKLKLYLHGCVDVKPKDRLQSLYESVVLALENEPNWITDEVERRR